MFCLCKALGALACVIAAISASAQMQMGPPETFLQTITAHSGSGTSAQPVSTPIPMLMTMRGSWMLMFHGNAFLADTQQSSPRGHDKLFSTNWIMPMAQHSAPGNHGQLTLRGMFSFEPATVTGRQYPLLFQQGETAYGVPIADGQHPHDFFMELAALYDLPLGERGLLSLYVAPVGDPALGPTAYPHRASAAENPVAALGHHQQDSTHIADDVLTLGLAWRFLRLEGSGFHGREPNEDRWLIQQGAIDSWSTRFTLAPSRNWIGQYSWGRLHSPEALLPNENQNRQTASIMYNRPIGHTDNSASTILWGRTREPGDDLIQDSYLFESTLRLHSRDYAFTRIENAARTNELLVGEQPIPPDFHETSAGHVQAYTFGYDRDIGNIPHLATAFGAMVTAYHTGPMLRPVYGTDPVGITFFLRVRPF